MVESFKFLQLHNHISLLYVTVSYNTRNEGFIIYLHHQVCLAVWYRLVQQRKHPTKVTLLKHHNIHILYAYMYVFASLSSVLDICSSVPTKLPASPVASDCFKLSALLQGVHVVQVKSHQCSLVLHTHSKLATLWLNHINNKQFHS